MIVNEPGVEEMVSQGIFNNMVGVYDTEMVTDFFVGDLSCKQGSCIKTRACNHFIFMSCFTVLIGDEL